MKVLKIIASIFLLVGAILLIVSFGIYSHTEKFLAEAKSAPGTVLELVPSQSSDSITYRPGVEYTTLEGKPVRFLDSVSSNPPGYSPGQKVRVLYLPEKACIQSFMSLWFGVLITGILGTVFALVGGGIFFGMAMGLRKKAYLKQYGVPVEASIQCVQLNSSFEVNGRNPWQIVAQWQDPDTSKLYVFTSENLWFDPAPFLNRQSVTVLIDKLNPKRHYMDISFLPEMA